MGIEPGSWDFGLEAGILALRLGFGPGGQDLGFKARILALRLGIGPRGRDLGYEGGEVMKEKDLSFGVGARI